MERLTSQEGQNAKNYGRENAELARVPREACKTAHEFSV
jgi:hypothetical protein